MLDHKAVLNDRTGNTDHVGFLEGISANHVARHLARQHHHRNRVHVGSGNTCNGISSARTGSHQHNTSLTSGTGITVRHMGSRLLMTNQNMVHLRFFKQGIVDMQQSTTRVPIDIFNAFVAQEADDHFSAG